MVNRRQLLKISALGTASFAAPLAYSASNITMAYNTGNPIGSTSPKDLSDNARNLDHLVNGTDASYLDRKGVPRKSWKGMEGEHNADQVRRESEFDTAQSERAIEYAGDKLERDTEFSADQDNREVQFNTFMNASGYEPPIPYAPGIMLDRITKTVTYLGKDYRVKSEFMPLVTSTWAVDMAKLKLVGDDSLRQDQANATDPSKGAGMVGFKGRTVRDELQDLSVPITRFGAIGDWNGVAGTNNVLALKKAFAEVQDYGSIYIPSGRFLIDVVDADLTDVGFARDYALIFLQGKTGVVFAGPGQIHFRCSSSSRRAQLIAFKNCTDCHVVGAKVRGDLVKVDGVADSATGVGYGFMFYNCVGSGISLSTLRNLIVPWWFTGQPKSPPTVADVAKECYVTTTLHDTFDQNSTFGAGASGLRVTNNTFIDAYTGFKISQNPELPESVGAGGRILFANNLVYWRPTAKFAAVSFSPTTAYPANGVVVESWSVDVLLADNIIDFSGITPPSLPLYGTAAPVLIYGGINQKRVTVQGGQLIAKAGYSPDAVSSASNITSLVIQGVRHVGRLRVFQVALGAEIGGDLTIKGNIGQGNNDTTLAIVVQNGRWDNVDISENSLTGVPGVETLGDTEMIYLQGVVCKSLTVKGNTLPNGKVGSYGGAATTCKRLSVSGNTGKGVSLTTIGVSTAAITGNDAVTASTAFELVLDAASKASCAVTLSGNSAMGPDGGNCSSAFRLNGGKLRMGGNAFHAVSGSAFVFDPSVNIMGGDYFGSGAPSQAAVTGTLYNDFAAGADGTYLKTTASGATGWKKLVTA